MILPSAVLFDVDGTLYHQGPLRAAMAAELLVAPVFQRGPRESIRLWKMLAAFRKARERLRANEATSQSLESLQYEYAAESVNVPVGRMREAVGEWILTRPNRYLPLVRRKGLRETLAWLRARDIQVGLFSDYPTRSKAEALGIAGSVSVHVCATDVEVNAFKPHPRGFLVACQQWAVDPATVLYVGDRSDVDAEGARRAGMSCVLVGRAAGPGVRMRRLSDLCAVVEAFRPIR